MGYLNKPMRISSIVLSRKISMILLMRRRANRRLFCLKNWPNFVKRKNREFRESLRVRFRLVCILSYRRFFKKREISILICLLRSQFNKRNI